MIRLKLPSFFQIRVFSTHLWIEKVNKWLKINCKNINCIYFCIHCIPVYRGRWLARLENSWSCIRKSEFKSANTKKIRKLHFNELKQKILKNLMRYQLDNLIQVITIYSSFCKIFCIIWIFENYNFALFRKDLTKLD